jgi:hypothetical protein
MYKYLLATARIIALSVYGMASGFAHGCEHTKSNDHYYNYNRYYYNYYYDLWYPKNANISQLTFVARLALPAGYAFFPAVRIAARVMTEPVVSWLTKLGACLTVVVTVTTYTYPVCHARRAAQVRQSFPLVARQQDTGICGFFDNG